MYKLWIDYLIEYNDLVWVGYDGPYEIGMR